MSQCGIISDIGPPWLSRKMVHKMVAAIIIMIVVIIVSYIQPTDHLRRAVYILHSLIHESHHWFIFFANDQPQRLMLRLYYFLLQLPILFMELWVQLLKIKHLKMFSVCLLGWKGRFIYACLCIIGFGFDFFCYQMLVHAVLCKTTCWWDHIGPRYLLQSYCLLFL